MNNVNNTKFGVFLPSYAFKTKEKNAASSFSRIRNIVLECERLGYDSVWLDDHLMFKKQPILECWTTLSALSTTSSKIRLGTMVLCNSFRNPAVLAKMAATIDVISKGRLEFGIGTGVQEDEHEAYGIPFLKPPTRTCRLKEAVEIIKKLWTEEKASYQGRYYITSEAVCEPKPVQKPHPPITIGGGGEKLTLKVTAQHADRYDWGYVPTLELYKDKMEVLESHCKAVGRDFNEIEKSCWLGGQIFIVPDKKEIEKKVSQLKPKNVSLKEFKKFNFVSTPDECKQEIHRYTSLGVTYFMLFFGDLPDMSSLRLFAEEVAKMTTKG
ncbi:TIGR03560 family F420-dependent LLM class oxidoreductase [Candidatus Bathyarchaeota archaeon]|nr:TIGR03560 family F420-dependent LLM class oxidoreductase [Candidatus Bathyarchaeota archaeon]